MLQPRQTRRAILLGTSILAATVQFVIASTAPGTNTHSRWSTAQAVLRSRGGGASAAAVAVVDYNADDNEELDAYIDALVAGVDDSEHDSPDVTHNESSAVAEPDDNDNNDADTNVYDDEERLRQSAIESQSHDEERLQQQEQQLQSMRRRRYPRPNAVYRFLLDRGLVGRILVMLLIWIAEFVRAFIPPLANAVSTVLAVIFGSRPPESLEDERGINNQYVAFVDSRRTLRGKDKKKAVRMADQEAAEHLRRVGSVSEARYKHLSQDFMQRHGLGPYTRDMEGEQPSETAMDNGERAQLDGTLVDEDEDVDWIVAALTDDDPMPVTRSGTLSNKPAIDVGLSSTGVTVGVSFSIGVGSAGANKKKKSKRRKKLIEAATLNIAEKRVKAGPRASDRDGGGGLLGRFRDFSANNLVSRSLLGAYPGDALPPMDAASAAGLCDFAVKYGYGDWSDEEDQYSAPSVKRQGQKKRNTTRNSNSSKRRRKPKSGSSSSSSSSSLSLDFDFAPPIPKTSTRLEKLPRRDSPPSDLKSRKSNKMVRLPTERLREKDAMLSKMDQELSQLDAATRRSRKLVRPPTELLREKDASLHKEPKG